jgi:hypothetical protein
MIDKSKKFEATYLKNLKDKLNASLKSFETRSLEQSLKETEESFRDPNLLIESFREMQHQQEEAIADVKLKLDEQSLVKENLVLTNEFKPNQTFSQDSFGQLRLNEYSSNDPFKSQILSSNQPSELIKLCGFSSKDKWTLLYRGSRDGFGANNIHAKCDGHSNTLSIIKAKGTSYIFGGFTSINWNGPEQFKSDPNAFLFSLTNKNNQPSKMRIIIYGDSIYCHTAYGLTFGGGHDVYIAYNANATRAGFSDLVNSNQPSQPSQVQSFLAGSYNIQLNEIEVYQKG